MSDNAKVDHPEYWHARGVGMGEGSGKCWVSGAPLGLGPDIAGFVSSREAGERVVAMLGHAKLDYREREPNWIQVKVAVAEEHKAVLLRLYDAVEATDGVLTPKLIAWVRDPEGNPGWKPKSLQYQEEVEQLRERVKFELSRQGL